ncbi:Trans-aconitate 2-methyltransferase [Rhodovastum atsumiense]|uniref:Methyltransferase domain-containing protein n=1 Tax=Rhodovastum atsumiense TaxID=504468 RepID=A0A5M6IXU2_9PROT|nr:methyltransferase domain-containing protein [Rhodovastum atsumiense]KAA5613102.1 methyltransferase domain-containing protein [Rhodovastum atsumiense]CAH2600027.1 Trans-aconitate 2-methyltransferase [Rhodovastum atsumiense]
MAAEWDPAIYLRYGDERLRPALDLLARVPLAAPARVVDLGCGAGNVSAILRQRFPTADITGVDGSGPMLARARAAAPDCAFVQADIAAWEPAVPPDLIYSNAALHWLDGHAALFPRLLATLASGGMLAVQMPLMHAAPLRALQHEVAANGPWAALLAGVGSAPAILAPSDYWDLLRPCCAALDLWETTYMHALQGEDAVVQWAMGTSLRPFLDPLPAELREGFLAAYRAALRPHYPRRPDGTTLLPFRRLFLVATAA